MQMEQLLLLLVLVCVIVLQVAGLSLEGGEAFESDDAPPLPPPGGKFPPGFLFGASSSAYQYEGATTQGGRGPSVWDNFTHKHPEKITDQSSGDIAIDSYHRYKEDASIIKELGMDAYRFSISWSRILPSGRLKGGINKVGITYYNNLINDLISKGIVPFVTLFHFDYPQGLEDQYGGFLSSEIVKDFRDYAEVCFREFGDRVKHWITVNEPWTFSSMAYALGTLAPGRCSSWVSETCGAGDSGREPYTVAHHQLLAHAAAVKLYKNKYQAFQKGIIGISLISHWMVPFSNSTVDEDAAQRGLDFMYGWFMDPLTHGDYPLNMKELVGERLPRFTKQQSSMIKGSYDFIGLNYYTAHYVSSIPLSTKTHASYLTDGRINQTGERNGVPIGPVTDSGRFYVYPQGLRDLLLYTKKKYNNPIIYITENGMEEFNNSTLSPDEAVNDDMRVDFYENHLACVLRATREGVDVRGYFAWTLMDAFEWFSGFTLRFGLNYVDYTDGLKRYPKKSALWFKKFLQSQRFSEIEAMK